MGSFWDFWHWWTTGRVAATAAAVGGAVAVVTGATAVRSLKVNREAAQRTARPMMVGTLQLTGQMKAGLVVTNAGNSIARKVLVSFDPPLPSHDTTSDGQPSILTFVRNRYAQPVDAWVPGFTARNEFLMLSDERDDQDRPLNVDGISRDTAIVFTYEDDDGNTYYDRISLAMPLVDGETWSVDRRMRNGTETVLRDGAPWLD